MLADGRAVPVTVSIGAAQVPGAGRFEDGLDLADAALYVAKDEGRDRVALYDAAVARRA
jgi:PleD family two-component response regulator